MQSCCDLEIVLLNRRQCDRNIAERRQRYSRGPLGIHKQQHNPTDQHECTDGWWDEVRVCGLNVYSKKVDRFSRSFEGEARVREHYDA